MKVYKTITQPKRGFPGLVVGIGNFDGVHLGHLKIIEAVKKNAGRKGTPGIITFAPHTRATVGEGNGVILTTPDQRLEYFRKLGIKVCWAVEFNQKFSRQTAGHFVREILFNRLGIKGICLGEGYRFGKNRRGNLRLLKKMADELGFRVEELAPVKVRGLRVSSSIIRQMIGRGEVDRAAQFLGRDYCLSGRVIKGLQKGKEWGYPTANFRPEQLMPGPGVYAARIRLGNGVHQGMLYIGRRPTLSGKKPRPLLAEAHLLAWRGNLYRRRIKVSLKKKIRQDIKFESLSDLYRRVRLDEKKVKSLLTRIIHPVYGMNNPVPVKKIAGSATIICYIICFTFV